MHQESERFPFPFDPKEKSEVNSRNKKGYQTFAIPLKLHILQETKGKEQEYEIVQSDHS